MSLIVRFFVVLFAFWIASVAGAAVLVLGAVAPGTPEIAAGGQDWPVIWFLIFTTSAFICAFAFVPWVIVVVLAEAFYWRSALLHAVAGAAVALFCGYTYGFIRDAPAFRMDRPLEGNFELIAAAGIAAGFVYWLFAGRSAGAWRERGTAVRP